MPATAAVSGKGNVELLSAETALSAPIDFFLMSVLLRADPSHVQSCLYFEVPFLL